jgi:hypothetical protein
MRRQDPCPGLAPLPRIMSRRPAATTTPLASSGRGRALTRRMADYFGLSYPHEIHSRGLAPHCVDPSEGQLRMAGCCCNHPGSYKIIARDVGTVTGMLDGEQYEGKERALSGGIHTFAQTSAGHDLMVFWAQAVNRHFRPIESNTAPDSRIKLPALLLSLLLTRCHF